MAPLVAKGVVVGTLELTETRREREFSGDEIGLVEAVCRVAGLAMDNALLIGDLERRNREAELLNEIARRTTASLDLGEIAEAAVAGLGRLVPIESYSLTLVEHGVFTPVVRVGAAPRAHAAAAGAGGELGRRARVGCSAARGHPRRLSRARAGAHEASPAASRAPPSACSTSTS